MVDKKQLKLTIGIGFQRSASSWLHNILSEHPEIIKPPRGLHYFGTDKTENLKLETYLEKILENGDGNDCEKALVEFSVSYGYPEKYQQCAEQIAEVISDIRLLCIVRNPVERAFSEYLRSLKAGELSSRESFRAAATKDKAYYLDRGVVGKVIDYYEGATKCKVWVLFWDDLHTNPTNFVKNLYSGIGVDSNYEPSMLKTVLGPGEAVKSQMLQKILITLKVSIVRVANYLGFSNFLDSVKRTKANRYIRNINKKRNLKISKEDYYYFVEYFRDDISRLEKIADRNLNHWLIHPDDRVIEK